MKSVNNKMRLEMDDYIQLFESLPCGAYIVKDDLDFTLIYGNPIFYDLFDCTEEKMKYKYGNRFGAIIASKDQDTLRNYLDKGAIEDSVWMELKISTMEGRSVWIHSGISSFNMKGERVLCCFCADITKVKNAEDELRKLYAILQFVVTRRKGEIVEYDLKRRSARIVIGGEMSAHFGFETGEIVPMFVERVISADVMSSEYAVKFKNLFHSATNSSDSSFQDIQINANQMRWVRVSVRPVCDQNSGEKYMIAFLENITQEKKASLNYLNETQYYQALLGEKTAYGHIDVTLDKILKVGGMWDFYNEVINKLTFSEIFDDYVEKLVHSDDRELYRDVMQCENFVQSFENGIKQVGCEFRRIVEQNKMTWMEIKVHLFKDSFTGHIMALLVVEDIDARKKHEIVQISNAERDRLTGVFSKRMMENLIREYMMTMGEKELCAYILLDIDDFKSLNDKYGHKVGDGVLQRIAKIITTAFRKQDFIGRLGSDTFMLFIKDIDDREKVIERLDVAYRFMEWDERFNLTCSMGITMVHPYHSYESIVRESIIALYDAKNNHKGGFCFYGNEPIKQEAEHFRMQYEKSRENYATFIEEPPKNGKTDSFDTFIGEQGDMAYLVNPKNYEIIIGNQAFYDRTGLTKSEIIGMRCYEVMQNRTSPCPFCSKSNWVEGKFYIWRNRSRALEQEFLMKNKLIQWQGQNLLLAIAVDISNDKSIADSMENSATEAHNVLSGIEKMTAATDLSEAMGVAMETIGYFFVADAVEFWHWSDDVKCYKLDCNWKAPEWGPSKSEVNKAVNSWLQNKRIEVPIVIENRESMLSYCYDMYELMEKYNVFNQRWIPLTNEDGIEGYIALYNISANFQNVSFLESFMLFIANERKSRGLLERILYTSHHDTLTGLLNRTSYDEYLKQFACDDVESLAVIIGDINGLKEVNRVQGFQSGDYYIQRSAHILDNAFKGDAVFRLSGDEFLVLVENKSQVEIEEKVKGVMDIVKRDNLFTLSLGFAWDNIEKDLSEMVEVATEVMKVNKARYYDSLEDINNANRHRMLQDLMTAIENKYFKVFLQPKVDFSNGKYSGAEALVRYQSEKTGLVPPVKFIGILEDNNFIRYVDMFVFEETCRLLERWTEEGHECPIISINFSRLTLLESDIVEIIEGIISKYNVNRNKIEIEVTESSGELGKGVLFQTIKSLYREGFSVSLDDFGTKYTNLSILSDVDFHVLKLDRSLISVIDKRERDRVVIKNVIAMCREIGIIVIAEGVETKEQEAILKAMGCDWGQGYLYGKPVPITEYERIYLD